MRLVFTSDGVGVTIRSVELYGIVKTAFWFRLRFHRLRSSENLVVGVASRSGRTKPSVGTCIVTGLSFRFSFRLRFRRPYDSACDTHFWCSEGHMRSYGSAYDSNPDSVASESIFSSSAYWRVLLKRGTGNVERGTGNGERGTSIGNGKMKNWKQNLTWNLALSATSFCSQFSSSRSPCWFPVPRSLFPALATSMLVSH